MDEGPKATEDGAEGASGRWRGHLREGGKRRRDSTTPMMMRIEGSMKGDCGQKREGSASRVVRAHGGKKKMVVWGEGQPQDMGRFEGVYIDVDKLAADLVSSRPKPVLFWTRYLIRMRG